MQNSITIFNQLLNLLPMSAFKNIVEEFKGDKNTKKFNTFHHFVTLFYAQLTGKDSLRDIETTINLNKNKLNFFSLPEIKRSTLSDANNKRDCRIFEELFNVILSKTIKLTPKHPFKFKNELYSIDSTTIKLCLNIFDWAKYKTRKGAVKIHTKLNHNGFIPDFLTITDGKKADITIAKEKFNFTPDSIVVMDKGYIDFEWLYSLNFKKVFFVTRAKKNLSYEVKEQLNFTEGTGVISDEKIILTGTKTDKAYPEELRMVKYYDYEKNKIYTFITNNFKLAAKTIADIYKSRWQIELFFKWIKQNLKIKSFIGVSENAVMSQIWVAMITYLLLSYIKFQTKSPLRILEFTRIIKAVLFQKVALIDLLSLEPSDMDYLDTNNSEGQLKLAF